MAQAIQQHLGEGLAVGGVPQELEDTFGDVELSAEVEVLHGLRLVTDIRANCGAACLTGADVSSPCPGGKVNGSVLECQKKLNEAFMKLRLSAERAWLRLLSHQKRVDLYGTGEHMTEYGELFETLFEHGPIELTPEILSISHSIDPGEIDEIAQALYLITRSRLIRYMHARGLISNPDEFVGQYYDVILSISCFGKLEDLENLQGHISQTRQETRAKAKSAALYQVREGRALVANSN